MTTRRVLIWVVVTATLLLGLVSPTAADVAHYSRAMSLLSDERLEEALVHVAAVEAEAPESTSALLLRARVLFLQSRFAEALELFNAARSTTDSDQLEEWLPFEALVMSSWHATRNMLSHPTTGGHFIIHVEPGPDEVLLLYAGRALESAYTHFAELFDYAPPTPIDVFVYPRIEDLAAVSSLKVSEIQASGTIALCKFRRLMITSPRDLLFGYDWLDTLAHEYIHLVIIQASRNTVPIWLHEGLAKFFENRWREPHDAELSTTSRDLLAAGLANDRLISFEEMSPSMAKLPNQQDTALAFAEVFTMVRYLKKRVGMEGILRIIREMAEGQTDREAITKVTGVKFSRFQKDWRQALESLELVQLPGGHTQRLYFKNRDRSEDELESIEEKDARNLTYLGDLLRARERFGAAEKEYSKAVALVGATSPVIQAKLATTRLALGKPESALSALVPALKFYPEYVLLSLHAGRAHLALGNLEQAAHFLEGAISLNPFDVEAHTHLLEVYNRLNRTQEAKREQRAISILRGN